MTGLFALSVALIGESVDCLYLRRAERQLKEGEAPERIYAISAVTPRQAITVSICIAMRGSGVSAARRFRHRLPGRRRDHGGLVLPYHRAAGTVRLSIYVGVAIVLFVLAAVLRGPPDTLYSMTRRAR